MKKRVKTYHLTAVFQIQIRSISGLPDPYHVTYLAG